MDVRKIVKYVFLFFVFVLFAGTVFFGVQWFSDSLVNLQIKGNKSLPADLQAGVDNTQVQADTIAPPPVVQSQPEVTPPPAPPAPAPAPNPQSQSLNISAEAAMSVQMENGQPTILFQKNAEEQLPIASLTKLMTFVVVSDNYDLSQMVTIDAAAMAQEGEQGDLKLGQIMTVKDLLYITLMESSNRSAYALSEVMGNAQFIALMNQDAQKLGLANTHYQDVAGLDSNSYSTAQDLVALTKYVYENYPLFRQIAGLKTYDLYLPDGTFHHTLINTDELLGKDNIVDGKTGFTDDAKGCLMTIQNSPDATASQTTPGDYTINIILGSNDRFGDMQAMIDWLAAHNNQ